MNKKFFIFLLITFLIHASPESKIVPLSTIYSLAKAHRVNRHISGEDKYGNQYKEPYTELMPAELLPHLFFKKDDENIFSFYTFNDKNFILTLNLKNGKKIFIQASPAMVIFTHQTNIFVEEGTTAYMLNVIKKIKKRWNFLLENEKYNMPPDLKKAGWKKVFDMGEVIPFDEGP